MAGPLDFFSPGQWEDSNQPGAQEQFQQFLNDPRGKAALLQTGLSLMGGRTWGDNPTSQIARAVGSGGEAVRETEKEARLQNADLRASEDQSSKQALRESQINEAGSRATAREASAVNAEGKLALNAKALQMKDDQFNQSIALNEKKYNGLLAIAQGKLDNAKNKTEADIAKGEIDTIIRQQRADNDTLRTNYLKDRTTVLGQQVQGLNDRSTTSARLTNQRLYQDHVKAIQARNGSILNTGKPKEPIPTYEEYTRSMGNSHLLTTSPAMEARPGAQSPTITAPSAPTVEPASSKPTTPAVGTEKNGYIFQGGDPALASSWKKKTGATVPVVDVEAGGQ